MAGIPGRGVLRALACAACLAACLLAPAAAPAAPKGADLALKGTSQSQILKRGAYVAVTAPRAWDVRVHVRVRGGKAGARSAAISRRKNASVERGGSLLRLRLNARGHRRLARCGKQKLVVQLRVTGSARRADRQRRLRASSSLTVDREACERPEPPAPRSFEVSPRETARHTNGTPRDYAASGLGPGPVRVAVFACENVTVGEGGVTFAGAETATPGSPGAGISAVDGAPLAGAPQQTEPRQASGAGGLTFTVSGTDGCGVPVVYADADGDAALDLGAGGIPSESFGAGGPVAFEPQGVSFANAGRCDPLDASACLHPFPNDHFTATDSETATGRRIDFNVLSMPANRLGVPILPTEHNRADGFSPGSMLITKVPGLDSEAAVEASALVPIDDLGRWDDPDQGLVVIDAATGERHPVWAEIDSNPEDPADRTLLVRPQRNFLEGHRYIVGLSDLRDAGGEPIPAGRAFQLYRDRIITADEAVESRRPAMEEMLGKLEAAGVERSGLNIAWDFTIASADSIAGRMLAMRDEAFAGLGDTNLADMIVQGTSPGFTITRSQEFTEAEDPRIARRVEGTLSVPCYLTIPLCLPGGQFTLDPSTGHPIRLPGNTAPVSFICNIPRSALAPEAEPARPSLYGHGLLGSADEVDGGNVRAMAAEHNMIMCATDWAGFSTKDAASIALILQDLNNFPKLADGSQQGFLNFLFLGRALIHPNGLGSHAAFQGPGGESLIDTSRLFYDGNSQGGILGGSLAAVAPDYDRAVLGVPGMNYSTLLRRSVDFDGYATGAIFGPDTPLGLYDNYPDELERPLVLSLMQMLWDRAEANGYAQHMTSDPLPNTPSHEVLLHVAFGDHQVANLTADVQARTIGAATNAPLDPGRFPGAEPLYDIPLIEAWPHEGSAIVYFDSGSPNAPKANVPPRDGADPHGHPRNDEAARRQKSAFLQIDGKVIDVCDGGPCYANGYTGPPAP